MSSSTKVARSQFKFGPYVPINRENDKILVDPCGLVSYYHDLTATDTDKRLIGEILPDDSIVDAPSLASPLLLKKKTIWPPRFPNADASSTQEEQPSIGSSDVEVIKIVSKDNSTSDIVVDNNPRYRKVEDYIKSTVVANLTQGDRLEPEKPILAIPDYFKSSAGELLFSMGLSRVQEFVLEEDVKRLARKIRKGRVELESDLNSVKSRLGITKKFNSRYKSANYMKCEHCNFKTESPIVLQEHLEAPHRNATKYYLCNWCKFRTKDAYQIAVHYRAIHKRHKCNIEKLLAIHCCRYCSFESNSKRKFTSHITKCEQKFQPDLVQAPEDPNNFPALTPKFITQQDVRVYKSTFESLRLAAYSPHQIKIATSARDSNTQQILVLPRSHVQTGVSTTSGNHAIPVSLVVSPYTDISSVIRDGSLALSKDSNIAQVQQDSSNLMRLLVNNSSSNNLPYNRISSLQHPKPQSVFVSGMSVTRNLPNIVMAPPNLRTYPGRFKVPKKKESPIQSPDEISSAEASCANLTFVICEICDSYIDDLKLFKSHMQWTHKVKIHQKLLESSRPPLSCQKCNWRFFTDQGLERHLLGSHGLVTTNMQELADNDKDAGRCTVCGIRCQRRLVAHMRDVHKLNLKPAQLSYKCTVCSANFSLYRHFENHVYRIHSGQAKQNEAS